MNENIEINTAGSLENGPESARPEINEKDFNILEVGCGELPFFLALDDKVDLSQAHYVGIDLDERELKDGRQRANRHNEIRADFPRKAEFIKGVLSNWHSPFKKESFNQVVLKNVLGEPLSDYYQVLNLLKSSLEALKKQGQVIIIEDYTPGHAKEILNYPDMIKFIKANFREVDNVYQFNPEYLCKRDASFIKTLEKYEKSENQS